MLPRDTKKVDALRNNYGFYLNSIISEFERIKNLNNDRHKLWVTKFIKTLIESFTDLQINLNDRCSYYDEIKEIEQKEKNINNNGDIKKDESSSTNNLTNSENNKEEDKTKKSTSSNESEKDERFPVSDEFILKEINKLIKDKTPWGQWSIESTETKVCSDPLTSNSYYYNPLKCNPKDFSTYYANSVDYKKLTDALNDGIYETTRYANEESNDDSIKKVITDLKTEYQGFLNEYINILNLFLEKITDITRLVREYSGTENLFGFINGKFIGINLKIILKYMKYSLGEDFYIVGICLILVGCGLILSISSTILLLVIINIELRQNMNPPVTPTGPTQGVSPFVPTPVINPPQY